MASSGFVIQSVGGKCRDHPELSEALCMEMMLRQLEAAGAPQTHRQVLACLAPWMHNLSFAARWEGGILSSGCMPLASTSQCKGGQIAAILTAAGGERVCFTLSETHLSLFLDYGQRCQESVSVYACELQEIGASSC